MTIDKTLTRSRATTITRGLLAAALSAAAILLPMLAATGCSADAAEEEVASTGQELSGSCGAKFGSCVRSGGGAACAARHCSGACVREVEQCARGGGGAGCANRCGGASSGTQVCQSREEWNEVGTSECGFLLPPFEGTVRGKARATCTYDCNGTRTGCWVWHTATGRAQCTAGIPVDLAGNPW